jgi:TldD protein
MSHLALKEALESLHRHDIDFADLFFESSSFHSSSFEDKTMEEISTSLREGVGARILFNDLTSFAHMPGVTLKDGLTALQEAALNMGIITPSTTLDNNLLERVVREVIPPQPADQKFFHYIDQALRQKSSLVTQVSINYTLSSRQIAIINDKGELRKDERAYTSFSVEVVVEKEEQIQTGYESAARAESPDLFWQHHDPDALAQRALDEALLMLDAPDCPAGTMPVLLSGEAGGTLIHEACGHGLEADIIQKDYSVYRNKLGEKVASPLVTMIDDGTISGLYGSYSIDDEGMPAKRTVLIENGILKAYLTDMVSSKKDNLPLSGNGRRSSYRNPPIPRMSNTFILPGNNEPEEMIKGIDYGLYVKRMGGGEVNPTTGDFVFQVTEGYLIQRGSIIHPVKGALLTGNGPEALMDIVGVGKDLHFLPGTCGKAGQSVPVTDGQPSLLIKKMTVGGSSTDHETL